jgi:hypothetical protein
MCDATMALLWIQTPCLIGVPSYRGHCSIYIKPLEMLEWRTHTRMHARTHALYTFIR